MKNVKRKLVKVAGTAYLRSTGRPAIVYGKACPQDELAHSVSDTELELILGIDFERDVKINSAIPDGVFTKDGQRFAVEVDEAGKQSRRQYEQKWKSYGRFDGFILVVCHTETRLTSVIEWAEMQKESCLFTTWDRLRAKEPWKDWFGNTATI